MKKIFSLILAFAMLGNIAVNAEMIISNPNGENSVKIDVTLPEKYEGEYVSMFVFNPEKTWADIASGQSSDVLQYNGQKVYNKDGISFDFTINRDLFEASLKPKFKAVLSVKDYKEELEFMAYSTQNKEQILSNVNTMSESSSYIDTITDEIVEMFNISVNLYESVSDKGGIAEKIVSILKTDEITASFDNLEEILTQATLLQAVNASEVELILQKAFTQNDVLGIASEFETVLADISDAGIEKIQSDVSGKSYASIGELKTALEKSIIENVIYNYKELGHGHVAEVVSTFSDYLSADGLDIAEYNNSSKSSVGKSLIAAGTLGYDAMISKINSLVSEVKGQTSSGGSSSSSSSGSSNVVKTGASSGTSAGTASGSTSNVTTGLLDLNEAPWAKTFVEDLYNKGIVAGNGNGYFYPNNKITRAEYTKMMVEAFGINDSGDVSFADVNDGQWFYPFIQRGVGANIIFGDGVNFYPDDNIKRQDIAVIAYRVLEIFGMTLEDTGAEMTFADANAISEYAYNAVKLLNQYGVINGSDNYVKPLDNATRAEASVIISSVLNLYKNGAVPKTPAVSTPVSGGATASKAAEDSVVSTLVRIGAVGVNDVANLTSTVTKAEFAGILADYAAVDGYANNEQRFSDVTADNDYIAEINAVTELGYMAAESGNNFEPNKAVTAGELSRAVVTVLGYGEAVGNFSDINAYHNKALDLDLYDGLSIAMNSYPTKNDIMNVLYNSLDVPVLGYDISAKVSLSQGDPYITAFHDLVSLKGVVEGNSVTNFDSAITPIRNTVSVSSEVLEYSEDLYYIDDYLGYYIEVFYDEDANEIVAFNKLKNDEIIIVDDEILDYSDGKIYYDEDNSGKEKSVKINNNLILIYNGVVKDNYTEDAFVVKNGSMEIIEPKNGDKTIVKIYEHDTLIANGISEAEQSIYTREGRVINLEDYDRVIIRDENDNLGKITDIAEGDVLSAAESEDGRNIIINYSRKTAEGILKQVDSSLNECLIGEDTYKYLDGADIKAADVGTYLTVYLDYKGKIAYVTLGQNNRWKYAYLIKASYDEAAQEVWIKYVNDKGEVITQAQTDSAIVDGEEVFGAKFVEQFKYNQDDEKQAEAVPQVVKYILSNDGEFKEIDTARQTSAETEESLSLDKDAYSKSRTFENSTMRFSENRGTYGIAYTENAMRVDENTVIFTVPHDDEIALAEDEDYEIVPVSSLVNRRAYNNVYGYDIDYENADLAGALVIKQSIMGADEERINYNTLFLVAQIQEILDGDEVVKSAYGYDFASSSWKNLTCGSRIDLFDKIQPGDVFRYNANGNKITGYALDFDYGTTALGWGYNPNHNGNGGFTGGAAAVGEAYGVFTHRNGNWLNFAKSIEYDENGELVRGKMTYDMSDTLVMLFDTSTNKIKTINSQELGSYIYTVNKDATAWIYTSYGALKACVVYI